ncbi:HNH endonuclease [Brevundimonas sp. VNH65]|uniref:HNH endonuclease n=1 Tax=Brevundimonas sp. VNH65 TaxID=3400917 RepID=UPI000A37893A|nr:HNH endonuclease [Novosphingobium panipatense]
MSPDPHTLAGRVSAEAGLDFEGSEGRDGEGRRWLELHPAGHPKANTFAIRATVGWRRLDVQLLPGTFAGALVEAMGAADETGRATFSAVLEKCRSDGAEVDFTVNGGAVAPDGPAAWSSPWRSMGLVVRRGMLAINEGDEEGDSRLIERWTARIAAAILALLPLEPHEEDIPETDAEGLPEGAKTRIEVNRYERDRRNRAAALAIHGYACKACDLQLDILYGDAATGLIEVHHLTPVSELGPGYIINPRDDLAPLCPNCHSVAHRRAPPYSIEELRAMLSRS